MTRKVDLDAHLRIAEAAEQDEWQWREGGDVLEGVHAGQVVLFASEEYETGEPGITCSIADRAHIAANSPPVTLALLARIRALEIALADTNEGLKMLADHYEPGVPLHRGRLEKTRLLLEKGAVVLSESPPPTPCQHITTERGKNSPRRWGSDRTEVCKACGAFRTHGHDPGRSNLSTWRPASEYAEATAEQELD